MPTINDLMPDEDKLRQFSYDEVSRLVSGILDVTDERSSIQKSNQLPSAPLFLDLNFTNRRRKGERPT